MWGGGQVGVYWQSAGRSPSTTLGTYATVLQAKINAMLAFAHEIHVHVRPEKYVSTCSDSQAPLKALGCQNDIPIGTTLSKGNK